MEGFEEGIDETIIPSTMGDDSVDTITADGGSESPGPRRMSKRCANVVFLVFIVTGLFAAMMSVGVAIGRSFGTWWNADASQASSTVASENVHTGVLDIQTR